MNGWGGKFDFTTRIATHIHVADGLYPVHVGPSVEAAQKLLIGRADGINARIPIVGIGL